MLAQLQVGFIPGSSGPFCPQSSPRSPRFSPRSELRTSIPISRLLIRTIVVVCVLVLIVYATRQFQNPMDLSVRTYLFLVCRAGTGASWLCYFRALKLGDAAQVAPIDKLSVVLVAVFGVVILGERLSVLSWAGIATVAAGAILVAIG